jgi:putative oxidoreductase
MNGLGLAVLRLALAAVFLLHGLHVLFGFWGSAAAGMGGLDATGARFQAAGLGPGHVVAVVAGLLQLAGGGLLVIGWLTRWVTVALALYTAVVAWFMHVEWGFFLNWTGAPGSGHGSEYAIVVMAALLCLGLSGPGAASIDGRRAHYAASRAAGRARALRRG